MEFHFNDSMSEEDVPNLNVIFTSETNAYGIINSAWVEGNQYSLSIDLKKKLGMSSVSDFLIPFSYSFRPLKPAIGRFSANLSCPGC